MRRLVRAAAAALLLVLSSSATALADPPGNPRWWISPAETAMITSCVTGNSAVIYGAEPVSLGTRVTGQVTYCAGEEHRYFGLEFFSTQSPPVAGYFLAGLVAGSSGATVEFSFTGDNFGNVTAMCVSAAPNDRLACAWVSIDGKTGAVSLTPIPVGDPAVAAPSGPMYYCDPAEHHIDPTCVTCL
ncbi:MAG TPA: hypothetical protein VFC19_20760 [Candidatus Limnocylindrales bacterium]|nr:hypothetical protein [Candidatus Limnocylindrales bacterium]